MSADEHDLGAWYFLTPNVLSIVHLNVQGLLGQKKCKIAGVCDIQHKIDNLRYSTKDIGAPAILCLTEIKLSDKIATAEISLPGYDIVRRDRNRGGGGVAIYWRSSLFAHELHPLSTSAANIECCVIELSQKQGSVLRVCYVYRPPRLSLSIWKPSLINLLDDLTADGKPLLLLGDFSENLLCDNSFASRLQTDFHLSQLINEPTRVTKSSATLIDHVYCSHKSIISLSGVANIHQSDHHLTFCELSGARSVNAKKFTLYRRIGRVDKEQFKKDFLALPWCILDSTNDIDVAVNIFEKLFCGLWDTHVPLKKHLVRSSQRKHWLNCELLASY